MVEGININSPRLSGTSETGGAVLKSVVASANTQKAQSPSGTGQVKSEIPNGVSSAVVKSAEKRLAALGSPDVGDFLRAAEKVIDASLPSKPPGTKLRINLDDGSGRFVYQGIDIKTGDVISQFPSEDVLKAIAASREQEGHEGIVVDEEV